MATFTWTADYPPVSNRKPRQTTVNLGDGYEHRLRFGLNTALWTWTVTFDNRSNTERAEIDAFFYDRGGVESFTWTNPFGNTRLYICEQWNIEYKTYNLNKITAEFREVPDQ
jgi:phage-related protein